MAIRRINWSQEWQQSALVQCYLLSPAYRGGLSFIGVAGIFIAGLKAVLSTWTQSPWVQSHGTALARWSGWSGIFSLRKDVKPAHSNQAPPWADNSIPVFKSLGLDLRLIWSDNFYSFPAWIPRQGMVLAVDHRSQGPAKPRCFQHSAGANLDQSSAGLFAAGISCWDRQTEPWILPCADPTLANPSLRLFFEGYVALFVSTFLLLPNFSECSRGNKLRKY